MSTQATEDYLKAIYDLQTPDAAVETTRLADHLAVTPASVSGMVKRLAVQGLVVHTPYYGVVLTERGRRAALHIIRRHRLVECLLSETLGVPWDEVHAEAERLEHVISSRLEEQIDALLGYPTVDPHGSPIPTRDGTLNVCARLRLADLSLGQAAVVAEVRDRDPGTLTYLARLHLYPGIRVSVDARTPVDHVLTVAVGSDRYVLGPEVTRQVLVTKVSSYNLVPV